MVLLVCVHEDCSEHEYKDIKDKAYERCRNCLKKVIGILVVEGILDHSEDEYHFVFQTIFLGQVDSFDDFTFSDKYKYCQYYIINKGCIKNIF